MRDGWQNKEKGPRGYWSDAAGLVLTASSLMLM